MIKFNLGLLQNKYLNLNHGLKLILIHLKQFVLLKYRTTKELCFGWIDDIQKDDITTNNNKKLFNFTLT